MLIGISYYFCKKYSLKVKLNNLPQSAKRSEAENKKFFARLKRNTPNDLDSKVKEFHEKVFTEIDCLACAN
jgi:hypothetical protein